MSHELQNAISLEMARCVADRLRAGTATCDQALANLDAWELKNANYPTLMRAYSEWRAILSQPVEAICEVMCAESDEGQRLRQNSPLVGVLEPELVREIKAKHLRHAEPAT